MTPVATQASDPTPFDYELIDALKSWRREWAARHGVTPFIVLSAP